MYRKDGRTIRPFSRQADIHCRGYSLPLQRIVVDFAADAAYSKASNKVKEHYDIELSASGIRQVTMLHAQKMVSAAQACIASEHVDGVEHVIAEMDGCMVPVVEIDKESDDKRTGKKLIWKELKLCLAHACGTKNPVFGGTFSGGVEQAGNQLLDCAIKAGFWKTKPITWCRRRS